MQVFDSLAALGPWSGREVACSDWWVIDQARIQRFADATGDQQWIHTDPQRARNESPFRAPVAHGYLTLSLLPHLLQSCIHIHGVSMGLNYGLDRVRFPAPVIAGSRVRARAVLERMVAVAGGMQAHWNITVELEHGDKPACSAQLLVRYYPAADGG